MNSLKPKQMQKKITKRKKNGPILPFSRGRFLNRRDENGPFRIGDLQGGATGESEKLCVPGGWAGTDDATSTAPSDLAIHRTEFMDGISEGMTTAEVDRWFRDQEVEEEVDSSVPKIDPEVELFNDRRRKIRRLAIARRKQAHLRNDFNILVSHRHSIRVFRKRSVERSVLVRLLESVQSAPSAGNLQSYLIYAVARKTNRLKVSKATLGQGFMKHAPVILVFCADQFEAKQKFGTRGTELYSVQDATIAASYAQLAAVSLNLASTWVGDFDEAKVIRALKLPLGLRPVVLMPVGYPGESPAPSSRKAMNRVVHWA